MFEIPEGDHFDDAQKFGKFVEKYNRTYETQEEYQRRFGIFKDNMRKVKLLQENERGTAIYGATAFADLTGSPKCHLFTYMSRDPVEALMMIMITHSIFLYEIRGGIFQETFGTPPRLENQNEAKASQDPESSQNSG